MVPARLAPRELRIGIAPSSRRRRRGAPETALRELREPARHERDQERQPALPHAVQAAAKPEVAR